MITQGFYLFMAFAMGIGLGLAFFFSLWWTVKKLPDSRHPALLTLSSLFVRLSVCVFGFYWVMDGQWERLLLALLGFLFMRRFFLRKWGVEASQLVSKYDGV